MPRPRSGPPWRGRSAKWGGPWCPLWGVVTQCIVLDSMPTDDRDTDGGPIRLDKWLWAARFYKTRSLAAEAVAGGKVQVNGDRAKRARALQVGDEVRVRLGPYEHTVVVQALSARRGPATAAARLYQERAESRAAREAMALQLKTLHSAFVSDKGRPTKRDRREIDRLKGRG
jgi:ribosome-associated heat shock protein Hsp15